MKPNSDIYEAALRDMPPDSVTAQWLTFGEWAQKNSIAIRRALEQQGEIKIKKSYML